MLNQSYDGTGEWLSMNYWWVNQNQTYTAEVQGGFLWSPKTNKNGARNQFYDNMALVKPGDLVFSFCDTRIKAIGRVTGAAEAASKPNFGAAGSNWQNEGWYVPVEFTELTNQPRPKDFITELIPHLAEKYAPLQRTGDGLQSVYLASVSSGFADVLIGKIGAEAKVIVEDEEPLEEATGAEQEAALQGRTDIGATTKRQLVLSRRGQGIFKANVRLNEKSCRVTGLADPTLLIASHIKPWSHSSDTEKLDGCNGLLLSPHIDRLFDKGLISFSDNGDVLFSSHLGSTVRGAWGLETLVNVGPFKPEQCRYLEYHRAEIFRD